MMVSLINDYPLFGATDDDMIKMLSIKIGKENNEKISETLFYRLKKEFMKKEENQNNVLITIPDTNLYSFIENGWSQNRFKKNC